MKQLQDENLWKNLLAYSFARDTQKCFQTIVQILKTRPDLTSQDIENELRSFDDSTFCKIPLYLFAEEFTQSLSMDITDKTKSYDISTGEEKPFLLGISNEWKREDALELFEPSCHDPERNLFRLKFTGFASDTKPSVKTFSNPLPLNEDKVKKAMNDLRSKNPDELQNMMSFAMNAMGEKGIEDIAKMMMKKM